MDKEESEKQITRIIEKYENLTPTERKHYNEANTRKNFILPLFEALGWDTRSDDVPEEERASGKRVDYAFKINGITKFFLEAKPLSADLDELRWAEQAIWYAYHKSVPWVVLTDFESIKVFNAEWDEQDAERNLVFEVSYKDYLTNDKLWFLSRLSIEKGELDEYAEREFKKPKRVAVDKQLVSDLLMWRDKLYVDFSGYNPLIDKKKIAENVQKVLNRIIFIRSCEDRGFEEKSLQEIVRNWEESKRKSDDLINNLRVLFREFDKNYDSKLFEERILFESEKFVVDDSTLAEVIKETYKGSRGIRWNFNDINADVLGSVYEQYLGQIHREDGEEKKSSKRKSQGIYYTPRYIVDYIIENTLGQLLKNKPAHEASKIKILDPACGSGSFLIKAFEVLDEHIRRENRQKGTDALINYARKLTILTSNIYGVDLDEEAVEIAQLNLLLKALEKRERLPNLSHHIECGNSLISGAEAELEKYFGKDWKDKKPFNWKDKFSDVFKQGGFDVIIGNPPYVRPEQVNKKDRNFFIDNDYFSKFFGRFDLYVLFIEQSLKLLKNDGYFSFIIPYSFLTQNYAKKIREWILKDFILISILDLSHVRVFSGAEVMSCVFVIRKRKPDTNAQVLILKPIEIGEFANKYNIAQTRLLKMPQFMIRTDLSEDADFIINKIKNNSYPLGKFCYCVVGLVPHDSKTGESKNRLIHKERKGESFKPYIEGKNMDRYVINWDNKFIDYQPALMHRPKFPELFENNKIIIRRITTDRGLISTYDDSNFYTNDGLTLCVQWFNLGAVKIKDVYPEKDLQMSKKYDLKFILALINSKLINFYFKKVLHTGLHVYPEAVRHLLVPKIDFSNNKEGEQYDELVKLANKMLKLNKDLQKFDPILYEEEYKELKSEIDKTDKEIDEKVYKLYGLTPEEIKIVENKD